MERVERLICSVKNYDWGKFGPNSEVYRLYVANCGDLVVDSNKPYAELWMGTHGSGSSYIEGSEGKTLKNWIEEHPYVLGDNVLDKYGCDLPFLFKVLSVAKPLSIQAHPCKELAKKLHFRYPNVYTDGNHKPEMALAITEFEVLCGFVGLKDLQNILDSVPEISQLVDSDVVDRIANIDPKDGEDEVKAALRQLFTQIMSASDYVIVKALSQLIDRLRKKDELTSIEKLVLRLEPQYPGDVGLLAAFLMNYVTLKPGEGLCLGENELHAYVSGDCIECMATSDNVVRAGLTSKHRDVNTLCQMLTYKQGHPEILRGFNVEGSNGCIKRYCPPFEEFEVDHCDLSEGRPTTFPTVSGPSLFLVTRGTGTIITAGSSDEKIIKVGDVLFATAGIALSVSSNETRQLEIYRAGINSMFL
ncbi:mannose-6-phosphate isomerase 1-like [Silene latifolia]|uniref:mannose-6-phosphate isomerase 1-like n=1 Tax=Silene latifolia TaxID=37657 RepID=UPI003D782450